MPAAVIFGATPGSPLCESSSSMRVARFFGPVTFISLRLAVIAFFRNPSLNAQIRTEPTMDVCYWQHY